ncbi:hypothetical protein K7432_016630 [Basidiobolus ranarum]|uniref:HTH APSES-type domain-containing protein n=1 Tax=Basidiobolus ranarum TaxID=34480 RepID=A0ABR2WEF4_9FUNG
MMNGDLCIDDDVISTLIQDPDTSSSPPFQRSQSNPVNSPMYDVPTAASLTVTPDPPIHKENGSDLAPEASLLTPDTTSLFERELDTHLIPNFGDEFGEDSSLITKNSSYVPLMELNNPETMPVSELDELLNGSPRIHDSSPKRLFGTRKKGTIKRTPFREFARYEENHDHKVPSREDEITENDISSFNTKADVTQMEIDSRSSDDSSILSQEGVFGTNPVDQTCLGDTMYVPKDTAIKNTSMKGIELFNESYPMLIDTEDKAPMVVAKVYSNVRVYETILPDTQLRLLRFHSNVPFDSASSQNKGDKGQKRSQVMLEESRHKDFCNASLLRKAAQPYVGDGKFESDDGNTRFVVIRNGPVECRGVWISLDRARHLVEEYGMQNVPHIQKLLSTDPLGERHDLESSFDPSEMDKHLMELSGVLQNAVAEYSLSQENHQNSKTPCQPDPCNVTMISEVQTADTNSVDSSIASHVNDIDPHTYISLDEDDEEQNVVDKQHELDGSGSSHSVTLSPSESDNPTIGERKSFIPTQTLTTPSIYMTVIESVPVYVTYISKGYGNNEMIQLMRRFDSGYINGTKLLMAGGMETESERTIVLSLEVGRVRVRKADSKLFGTWIPLPRARALASTCSLQHKLGPFLDDNLPTYFPNPLPSSITTARSMRLTSRLHQVLKAKASTFSTRNAIGSSIGIAPQSLHPSKSCFSGPNYHIYQILGLQGSKQSKSAALSGIFGGPSVVGSHDDKSGKRWSKKVKSRFTYGKRAHKGLHDEIVDKPKNSKVNSLLFANTTVAKKETESDNEIEQVRKIIQIQR